MKQYIGLDVSLEETHICVVDEGGVVLAQGVAPTEPDDLAQAILQMSSHLELVVLETGGQSAWLEQSLTTRGITVAIIDARRAKAALSARLNKTDTNDAEGLAQLARTGWYRRVLAKSVQTRSVRALLVGREQLVGQRRALNNQIRGILRGFGLKVGQVSHVRFHDRIEDLMGDEVALHDAIHPLLSVLRTLGHSIACFDKRLAEEASTDEVCQRLMSVPGVGPLTALAFKTALDEPTRFARSADVGAYLGLTPRRYQSGQVDRTGRISKQGDAMARHMLYEAANVLLSRVKKWTRQKSWAARLVARSSSRKARVALARKLAVILHRIWVDGTTFNWSAKPAM